MKTRADIYREAGLTPQEIGQVQQVLERNAPPKPKKGDARLDLATKRRDRKALEDATMRAAKDRDGHRCRFPWCQFRHLRVEACHEVHRGMGGNPKGDRTTRAALITFCIRHHQAWDHAEFDARPMTPQGFDGPVEFYERNARGDWEVFAAERIIGISVVRTA